VRYEVARAKVNLTLEIRGRRADGYHELESVVLFADFGDRIAYSFDETDFTLDVDGPFAAACQNFADNNLIRTAAEAFCTSVGTTARGHFQLTKNLPIAAGIGGGSADAATTLRLLAAEQIETVRRVLSDDALAALIPMARQIGADVPVCLYSRAALMTGVGDRLHLLREIEPIPAVLVNPRLPLATRDVFCKLGAKLLECQPEPPKMPAFRGGDAILAYARVRANDLEAPARQLLPCIDDILNVLKNAPGATLARLSGSGPTCFALFNEQAAAESAAAVIQEAQPGWWVQATRLS
jgi:4-diphosphocytidyl-2-C-methyl-D-erythritol kinase